MAHTCNTAATPTPSRDQADDNAPIVTPEQIAKMIQVIRGTKRKQEDDNAPIVTPQEIAAITQVIRGTKRKTPDAVPPICSPSLDQDDDDDAPIVFRNQHTPAIPAAPVPIIRTLREYYRIQEKSPYYGNGQDLASWDFSQHISECHTRKQAEKAGGVYICKGELRIIRKKAKSAKHTDSGQYFRIAEYDDPYYSVLRDMEPEQLASLDAHMGEVAASMGFDHLGMIMTARVAEGIYADLQYYGTNTALTHRVFLDDLARIPPAFLVGGC